MIDSTNPRIMADNIRHLAAAGSGGSTVVPNPEGESAGDLSSLGIDGTKYGIPVYSPTAYSTDEADTGVTWIDGNKIYRKVISVGTLPNNTTKSIATGISNLGIMLRIYGIANTEAGGACPLPYVDDAYVSGNILIDYQANGDVRIISGSDKSLYTGYVILEYTKKAASSAKSTKKKINYRRK